MMGISGIVLYSSLSRTNPYNSYMQRLQGAQDLKAAQQTAQSVESGMKLQLTGTPKAPVQPVQPIGAPTAHTPEGIDAAEMLRQGADPAEVAVRMRIQKAYPEAEMPKPLGQEEEAVGAEAAQKAAEEGECQTCKERKYQDGSDDPGVSFKTAAHIAPEVAGAAVRGHEMEHVVREQAKAKREGKHVVSQSVTIHTAICPECGKAYVSGGTTRTTTAAESNLEQPVYKGEKLSAVA